MRIYDITLHRLILPLITPYRISFAEFRNLDPIIAEVRTDDGRVGWGETQITPGYGHETPEQAWTYCEDRARRMLGLTPEEARRLLLPDATAQPGAVCTLMAALETIEGNPILSPEVETRVPLLEAVQAKGLDGLEEEIERLVGGGFRTLKVKVGWDVARDLQRVAAIQRLVDGRALIRLDANQGFDAEQGRAFAAALEPAGIMLLEQPCHEADWEANAAVAAVSRVPVMLDESIFGVDDIDRAANIPGVRFIKLKLKKLGGLDLLRQGLERIRGLGLTPVLGDGMSIEIGCWLEACVARLAIDNAGEMNGFLKPHARILADRLPFERGDIVLRPGFRPMLDDAVVAAHRIAHARIARPMTAVRATN